MQQTFHVQFDKKRTTISVDTILVVMMAARLGVSPDSQDAHGALRRWLQSVLPEKLGASSGRKSASQWARRYLIEEVASPKVRSFLLPISL